MVVAGDGRSRVTELLEREKTGGGPNQAGQAYLVNTPGCTADGTGGNAISPNSTAIFLLQDVSGSEVVIVREGPGGRYVYMDGREHPPLTKLTRGQYGHSTGRYENGVLVIETVGLSEGNVTGGGKRRPETRLTERFLLSPDGKRLTIRYIWDDPALYVRPHMYETVFERLPSDSYAFETWCDSSDPLQQQSIVPPKQLQ